MHRLESRRRSAAMSGWLRWSMMLAMLWSLQGCAGVVRTMAPRMVPIQTARITQMEFYRQWYTFKNADHAKSVFSRLLGKENWRVLEEHKSQRPVVEDLLAQRLEVRGSLIFTISVVPTAQDSFFVEGTGRYFMVRQTTNEILLSGDYYIKNKRYAIRDMNQGRILLDVKQYIIRYFAPSEVNYYQDVPVSFVIQIDARLKEKSIYSIDYSPESKHYVVFEKEIIGYLEFDASTPRNDKLIDLRGRELIMDDYGQVLKDRQ